MTRTDIPFRRAAAPRGAGAALLLAAFVCGGAQALVHDRAPGDDLGGASTLPEVRSIGEDDGARIHGGDPVTAPGERAATI